MESLNDILAVILGGGRGSRLYPLTKLRSKPAVPMGGKYRLIDVPISNCINSSIYRIAVLTQFNSVSLHRHITRTYSFDAFHTGWVTIWAAEQTMESSDWYQGTADAVRKQLFQIRASNAKFVLILAGDHLYRMDYAAMAAFHWQKNAEITVAVQPVPKTEAFRLGILKRDENHRIQKFAEKPTDPAVLADMVSRDDPERPFLGSMGIYMFNTELLLDLLENETFPDFGKDLIPGAIQSRGVYGYDFDGYWEDIGTIRSFYETNLALTKADPPFDLFEAERPIYTAPLFLPGSKVVDSNLKDVLITEGCRVANANIQHSVVGLRSIIRQGAVIKDSIIMGADYYELTANRRKNQIPIGIGPDCVIEGAIIDKNARVGKDVVIKPFPKGTDIDADPWFVRDGIVVIPKDAILQPGTHICPE